MLGSDFMLNGGKGGLGFSSSSRTGANNSGGKWDGSINYADNKANYTMAGVVLVVLGFVFFLLKKG